MFRWKDEPILLTEVARNTLPAVVKTTDNPQDGLNIIPANTTLVVHSVVSQRRLVARFEHSGEIIFISIPSAYHLQLREKNKIKPQTKLTTPRRLLDRGKQAYPRAVTLSKKSPPLRVGEREFHTAQVRSVVLEGEMELEFLQANTIVDGEMVGETIWIPESSEMKLLVGDGLLVGSRVDWEELLDKFHCQHNAEYATVSPPSDLLFVGEGEIKSIRRRSSNQENKTSPSSESSTESLPCAETNGSERSSPTDFNRNRIAINGDLSHAEEISKRQSESRSTLRNEEIEVDAADGSSCCCCLWNSKSRKKPNKAGRLGTGEVNNTNLSSESDRLLSCHSRILSEQEIDESNQCDSITANRVRELHYLHQKLRQHQGCDGVQSGAETSTDSKKKKQRSHNAKNHKTN